MPRNGSGTFSAPINAWNPALNGVSATAADWQTLLNDLVAAMTQSVSADGQTPITGNLAMGGNKLTGLGAGVATGQSLRFEQLFDQGTEADLASGATTDIGAQNTNFLQVTGTTTITSFGTTYRGPRFVRFSGALTLTHNATTLILPGAASILTVAGDVAIVVPVATAGTPTGWKVVGYQRAAGMPATAGPLVSSGITGAAASGANTDITSLGNNTSAIYTTAGTSTAYTITPNPAIAAYAIGQSFFVNFNAVSGASPTLQLNGIATPPNLVKENPDGTYSNIAANDIPINHRSRVTLISTTQALVERLPSTTAMCRVQGHAGYGSTNTSIRRFTNVLSTTGDVTYADSATLGGTFTIVTPGLYVISTAYSAGADSNQGISLNSSQLSTDIASITATDRLISERVVAAGGVISCATPAYLATGAVIRAHGDNVGPSSTALANFTIVKFP